MWRAGPAPSRKAPGRRFPLRPGFALTAGQRVGLYGGSFNPAHSGHAHVAETALRRLSLDLVIWLVSPGSPLKRGHATAPLAARMASVARLARGRRMHVSDVEARIGVAFTADTVAALKARFPGVHFVWLMGADSLATFHLWRGWTRLLRTLPVAVVSRPGHALRGRFAPAARRFAFARVPEARAAGLATMPPPAWVYLTAPFDPASSTRLRERG